MCALSLCTSCDYEDINTDATGMTEEEGNRDGFAVGGKVVTMQRTVIPVGTQADDTDIINTYQIGYNLSMDCWSGFFGQNNDWGGNANPTYFLRDSWIKTTYTNAYTNALAPWKRLKMQADNTGKPEIYAFAQILKISAWHKALECFGPIPYSHAADAVMDIPFDSEKDIYTAMLADLKAAVDELTPKAEAGVRLFEDFDILYAGDLKKWVKYANSLMLRLAMRVRFADEQMAKTYAKYAIDHSIGVMMAKDDEAQVSRGGGMSFRNNINWLATQYNETRMGSSIYSYLMGYQDPRLSAYFLPVDAKSDAGVQAFDGKKYQAVPAGHRNGQNDVYKLFSLPNIVDDTPTYWMRASEVYFLRAEAALIWGAEFGDEAVLYKEGVAMSFQENGISASADVYLSSNKVPMAHKIEGKMAGNFGTPKAVTPKFEGSTEEKFEKIMIQKWIALYPNGLEAWTEWRRSGYPDLNPVVVNEGTSMGATKEGGVRRMIYPASFQESEGSKAVYQDALQKLGGEDRCDTRLWWDCNPKVNF